MGEGLTYYYYLRRDFEIRIWTVTPFPPPSPSLWTADVCSKRFREVRRSRKFSLSPSSLIPLRGWKIRITRLHPRSDRHGGGRGAGEGGGESEATRAVPRTPSGRGKLVFPYEGARRDLPAPRKFHISERATETNLIS